MDNPRSAVILKWVLRDGFLCQFCGSKKLRLRSVTDQFVDTGVHQVIDFWVCDSCQKVASWPWMEIVNEHPDRFVTVRRAVQEGTSRPVPELPGGGGGRNLRLEKRGASPRPGLGKEGPTYPGWKPSRAAQKAAILWGLLLAAGLVVLGVFFLAALLYFGLLGA